MAKHKQLTRILAWILTALMTVGCMPTSVFASDDYDIVVDGGDDYTVTVDDGSGEKEVTQEEDNTQSKESAAAGRKSGSATAEGNETDRKSGNTSVKEMDFSSCRLLVGTKNKSLIPDKGNILSSYNGVYLLGYETEKDTEKAYLEISKKTGVDFCAPDTPVKAASESTDAEGITDMTKQDNPISELKSELNDGSETHRLQENVIALLDSGASASDNVIDAVSMIGDNTADDNGHGEKMVETILSQNPDAKIISIKVLDKNGEGNASSIYAGIEYAIQKGAAIVNLSLSGYAKEENEAVRTIIEDAAGNGMAVIGAAGNNGIDAKYCMPGSVDYAIIAGSCDENGNRRSDSNYGKTVDYLVNADTTSEAAAILSGYASKYMDHHDVDFLAHETGLIFANEEAIDTDSIISDDKGGTFHAAAHTCGPYTGGNSKVYMASRPGRAGSDRNERLHMIDGQLAICVDPGTFLGGDGEVVEVTRPISADMESRLALYQYFVRHYVGKGVAEFPASDNDLYFGPPYSHWAIQAYAWTLRYGLHYELSIGQARTERINALFDQWYAAYKDYFTITAHYYRRVGRPNGQPLAQFEATPKTVCIGVHKIDSTTKASLGGAKIGVYRDNVWHTMDIEWEGSKPVVKSGAKPYKTLTTDANGNADVGDLSSLYTYYFQEVEAPAGYKLDKTKIVGSHPSTTGTVEQRDDLSNGPGKNLPYDPGTLTLHKQDGEGTAYDGVKFHLTYVDDVTDDDNTEYEGTKIGKHDAREWVFVTKNGGQIDLQHGVRRYFDSGDELFTLESGAVVFWPGSYELWEDEASAEALGLVPDTTHYEAKVVYDKEKNSASFEWVSKKGSDGKNLDISNTLTVVNKPKDETTEIKIRKWTKDLLRNQAAGDVEDLSGAEFVLHWAYEKVNVVKYTAENGARDWHGQKTGGISGWKRGCVVKTFYLRQLFENEQYAKYVREGKEVPVEEISGDASGLQDTDGTQYKYEIAEFKSGTAEGTTDAEGIATLSDIPQNSSFYIEETKTLENGGYAAFTEAYNRGDLQTMGWDGSTQPLFIRTPDSQMSVADGSYIFGDFEGSTAYTKGKAVEGLEYEVVEPITTRYRLKVVKKSTTEGVKDGQGDASLAGAVFTITNSSKNPVKWPLSEDGKIIEPGENLQHRDENGKWTDQFRVTEEDKELALDDLTYGTYTVTEVRAPEGYNIDPDYASGKAFELHDANVEDSAEFSDANTATVKNIPKRGKITISKKDQQTGKNSAQLNEGDKVAVEIINSSKTAAYYGGNEDGTGDVQAYEPGEVMDTLTLTYSKGKGWGSVTSKYMDYGTYTVREVKTGEKAGNNYLASDHYLVDEDRVAVVHGDHETVSITIKDPAVRADLEFTKIDGNENERLANVPFLITNLRTGEQHVAVTDKSGYFSSEASSRNRHSNLNGNDKIIKALAEAGYLTEKAKGSDEEGNLQTVFTCTTSSLARHTGSKRRCMSWTAKRS